MDQAIRRSTLYLYQTP